MLAACRDLPVIELAPGDVLVREGQERTALFVLVDGTLEVSRQGSMLAAISEPGSVIGEIAVLLDLCHGATVTATSLVHVHVIHDADAFLASDHERLRAIACTLATRLNRLTSYLSDVRTHYASAGGHLALLDEVLAELSFGTEPPARPGSVRDPDPLY